MAYPGVARPEGANPKDGANIFSRRFSRNLHAIERNWTDVACVLASTSLDPPIYNSVPLQWQIQNFPYWGHNLLFGPHSPENAMKMKEIVPGEGILSLEPHTPIGSANKLSADNLK